MEAEQVIEKIIQEAKAQAEQIKAKAAQKQAAEKASLDATLQEYQKQTQALAQKAAADELEHLLAQARMELAKELLAKKRQVLDQVFAQVGQRIKDMPADQYRALSAALMAQVSTGHEEVVIGKQEERIDQSLIDQVNKTLSEAGRPAGLKLADQRASIEAGFILKRGRIQTNCSLGVLLDQARRDLEMELAGELFA